MPSQPKQDRFSPFGRQSHFVSLFCILCIAGIWLAKLRPLNYPVSIHLSLVGLLGLFIILFFKRKPSLCRLILLLVCPSLLYLSSSNFALSLRVYDDLYDSKLSIIGVVQDDAAYNNYGDYEFNISKLFMAEDGRYLPGRIRVRTKQQATVYRSNRVLVSGKLKPALGSRTGSISYAEVEVLESSLSPLEEFRLKFFSTVYSSMPEPHGSLGIGFLAGVRSSMTKEFQDQLSKVGLTHIVAVSGYNLTILVMMISRLGKRLSRYQQLLASLVLISTFLLITGFAPSIVRAAVVSCISISALFFGRKISALNIILLSALITAGFNPTYLWEDIGWWLSFLAFFGVLILAPAITQKVYKEKEPGLVAGIVIESFSAQLVTAPLIAHVFGTFSVISLLANVLIIPWIPFVMLLVFLVGTVGMLYPQFGVLLALLPKVVLTVIIWLIEKLSSLSWASASLRFSQPGMLGCYLLVLGFIKLSRPRHKVDL